VQWLANLDFPLDPYRSNVVAVYDGAMQSSEVKSIILEVASAKGA
jgi:hypothetical protein